MTMRPFFAMLLAASVGLVACSQSDRSETNSSIDAAASAAAAVANAVATDAAKTIAAAPSAAAGAQQAANGAVATIRAGAGQAEHAIDDATRAATPPAKNFARATAVKAKLIAIDATSGYATNVVAAGDVVHLTGKVTSAAIGSSFAAAARTVPGVRRVDSHLAVDAHLPNPVQPARDLALGAEVRANLAAAGGLAAVDLDVEAHDGTVTLSGNVADAGLRAKLEKAARDTAGVAHVDDTLTVQ